MEKKKKKEDCEITEDDRNKFQHLKKFFKLESAAIIGESRDKNYYVKCLYCKATKPRKFQKTENRIQNT